MTKQILILALALTLHSFPGMAKNPAKEASAVSITLPEELQAYYNEVSRTVVEGDFKGMVALYHKEGVLVTSKKSMPIAEALAGWKPGIEDTKMGKNKSNVSFRFSELKSDAATAHITGIFHYTSEETSGKTLADEYIDFEMLLIKQKDNWVALMEYQKSRTTVEKWEALK